MESISHQFRHLVRKLMKKLWHWVQLSAKRQSSVVLEDGMRVLLVEDDLAAARGVILMLKSSGTVVDQADTGEEALELVRHYDYDIVILDLMLPDMEGYEVVRRMRAARV